ncbi:hypothetical protein ACRRTK_001428 [Alexandromys fortis]
MSSLAATTFRWKKCRLDLPGQVSLQACKRSPDASSPRSLTEVTRQALHQVFDFFGLKLLNITVSKIDELEDSEFQLSLGVTGVLRLFPGALMSSEQDLGFVTFL